MKVLTTWVELVLIGKSIFLPNQSNASIELEVTQSGLPAMNAQPTFRLEVSEGGEA